MSEELVPVTIHITRQGLEELRRGDYVFRVYLEERDGINRLCALHPKDDPSAEALLRVLCGEPDRTSEHAPPAPPPSESVARNMVLWSSYLDSL